MAGGAIDRMKLATIRTERRYIGVAITCGLLGNKRYLFIAVGTSILNWGHNTGNFVSALQLRNLVCVLQHRYFGCDAKQGLRPRMVPYAGHRRAPLMRGALAGVVHHCQRAYDQKRYCAQDDQQRGFHGALA